jgi:hypothetical protein
MSRHAYLDWDFKVNIKLGISRHPNNVGQLDCETGSLVQVVAGEDFES